MKRIIFLLFGIFIFAFGCNEDILPADPLLENETLKKAEVKMVPSIGEVFNYYNEEHPDWGTISGFLSHFGKLDETKSTWEFVSSDMSQFPPLITSIHDIVFCAANGDLAYGTFTGTVDVTTFEVNGTLVLEGGTGRFENVSGQSTVNGYVVFDEEGNRLGMYLAGEGEISNVGSSK
ncbi:hypothetical protein [Maribellus mangrovi]|uniref:hypothetical protein n=1 Tax=Maribellus mangrovi TaxID=3133146 RepID=UPI0030EC8176